MKPYRPDRIFIEQSVADSPITRRLLDQTVGVPTEEIDSKDSLLANSKRRNPTLHRAKKSLILARHRGQFFKPCPAGTAKDGNRTVCCNYFVINYASNCHMECSYCYLQDYLNFPYMIVYANVHDLFSELEQVFSANPTQSFRIGTGELADSLALDPLTGYSEHLVRFFARRSNAVLELKTKSDCVENLIDLTHGGRTVVSWSINPEFIQRTEEHKTASIGQRLAAAQRCAQAGYPVAFHLDPLIFYPAWERDYRDLIIRIFSTIPAISISWISLGSLRMSKRLKEIIRERFPGSRLPLGELVPGQDGKLRYFKPLRIQMYRAILECVRSFSPRTPTYACMEHADVWHKVFEGNPPTDQALGASIIKLVV